jgi:hypothetical protein
MIIHDPKRRPQTTEELVKPLSELREKLFGRKSSGKDLKVS